MERQGGTEPLVNSHRPLTTVTGWCDSLPTITVLVTWDSWAGAVPEGCHAFE